MVLVVNVVLLLVEAVVEDGVPLVEGAGPGGGLEGVEDQTGLATLANPKALRASSKHCDSVMSHN